MNNCHLCKPYCNYAVLDCGCPCHRPLTQKQWKHIIEAPPMSWTDAFDAMYTAIIKREQQPIPHESNFSAMEQHVADRMTADIYSTNKQADCTLQLD